MAEFKRVPLERVLESLPLYPPHELRQIANEIMKLDVTRMRSVCTCPEREFRCPFCREVFTAPLRSFECSKHGHAGPFPDVQCRFCRR